MVKGQFGSGRLAAVLAAFLCVVSFDSHARNVRSVVINQTGMVQGTKDGEDPMLIRECGRFKPTPAQVRAYFSKAYPVPGFVLNHDRYSPCYATGTVEFADGFGGEWILYSSGSAGLEWAGGGGVYLLYKRNKWHDPFACTYGLGDEPGC